MKKYNEKSLFGLPQKAAYCLIIGMWVLCAFIIIAQHRVIRQYEHMINEVIHTNQTYQAPNLELTKPEPPYDNMTISEYNSLFKDNDCPNR